MARDDPGSAVTELTISRALPERPALSPWFRLSAGDDRLLLEHGGTVISFAGRAANLLLPSLLPLLDGSRTVRDLLETLGEPAAPATLNALELLNAEGALLDGPQPSRADGLSGEAALFVATLAGNSPAEALASLATGGVAVAGASAVAAEILRVLTGTGLDRIRAVDVDDLGEPSEFLVAAPAHEELHELLSINERRLELDAPWLQVLPNDGRMVAIGPLFVPGISACHVCYRIRRGACSGFEDDFERVETVAPKAGSPPPITMVAAGVAGMLALRWLGAADPTLPGRLYTLETDVVLGLGYHHVLRVPRCAACGAADAPMPAPWFEVKARA